MYWHNRRLELYARLEHALADIKVSVIDQNLELTKIQVEQEKCRVKATRARMALTDKKKAHIKMARAAVALKHRLKDVYL